MAQKNYKQQYLTYLKPITFASVELGTVSCGISQFYWCNCNLGTLVITAIHHEVGIFTATSEHHVKD